MNNRNKLKRVFSHFRHRLRHHKIPSFKNWNFKKIAIYTILSGIASIALFILVFFAALAVFSIGLPDVKDLDNLSVPQSTTIYDREGNVLYVNFAEENRAYVSLNQISKHLIDATLAIEDDKFYEHPGFDSFGVLRAAINNLRGRSTQGASTITQQYIKLTFLTSEKSYSRKIKELILALKMEQSFDKDIILEKYLNKIPYGNNSFGAETASGTYFGKKASELTIAESAILAAIPQAPSYYNPYGERKYSKLSQNINIEKLSEKKELKENNFKNNEIIRGLIGNEIEINENLKVYIQGRTDLVLKRMLETERITNSEYLNAFEELKTLEFKKRIQNITAPHFVFFVLAQLEEKYGKEIVGQGGLKVYTTIDPILQKTAEQTIKDRSENYEKRFNVKNSSLVALDPNTGEILAMVGSRNYFDENIDGKTNIVTSFRQPGSSFKPIVYGAAFLNRYAPASVIFDVETKFGSDSPKNFDGKFLGPISIRKSLGLSRNIPAIKAYFLAGEQDPIIKFAKSTGIKFLDENRTYGYPLALGSAEVTLLSLANSYATFANGGILINPVSILKIENNKKEILEEYFFESINKTPSIDPQIAFLITSILSDKENRVGQNISLNKHTVAVKTGTSNIKKDGRHYPNDLLTVGYTPDLVTAVWSGNNDVRKDGFVGIGADGYNVSGPIFKEFMDKALENTPVQEFTIPSGIKKITVSKLSGKLAGEFTPTNLLVEDYFANFSVPTEIDNSFTKIPNFLAAEKLSESFCKNGETQSIYTVKLNDIDPSKIVWEEAAQKWLNDNPNFLENIGSKLGCEKTPESFVPKVEIVNLKDNETITTDNLIIRIRTSTRNGVQSANYYLDDNLKYIQNNSPFFGTVRIPKKNANEKYTLTVRIFDKNGSIGETSIIINTKPGLENTTSEKPQSENQEETNEKSIPYNQNSNEKTNSSSDESLNDENGIQE